MMLSGKARIAGVMGWPVGHSRSPRLHGWWLDRYAVDGAYVPMAVRPDDLEAALRALPALGFAGCNLTIPHKEAALRLVDRIDPVARRIGAVNTIRVAADGTLEGSNTDAFGFLANLRQEAPGWTVPRRAVVLGAGGGARAVIAALIEAGVREIRLVNRSGARAEALAADFGGETEMTAADFGGETGTTTADFGGTRTCVAVPWEERAEALAGIDLLVNTTSLGMTGQPGLDLPLDRLPPQALVTDIVYVPLVTPLLAAARARGNPVVDGLGMLLHQGRPGFEAWFGVAPEVTAKLRAHLVATL